MAGGIRYGPRCIVVPRHIIVLVIPVEAIVYLRADIELPVCVLDANVYNFWVVLVDAPVSYKGMPMSMTTHVPPERIYLSWVQHRSSVTRYCCQGGMMHS